MNPYITAELSVPAQWMRPHGSRREGPNSVSTPGGVWEKTPADRRRQTLQTLARIVAKRLPPPLPPEEVAHDRH